MKPCKIRISEGIARLSGMGLTVNLLRNSGPDRQAYAGLLDELTHDLQEMFHLLAKCDKEDWGNESRAMRPHHTD